MILDSKFTIDIWYTVLVLMQLTSITYFMNHEEWGEWINWNDNTIYQSNVCSKRMNMYPYLLLNLHFPQSIKVWRFIVDLPPRATVYRVIVIQFKDSSKEDKGVARGPFWTENLMSQQLIQNHQIWKKQLGEQEHPFDVSFFKNCARWRFSY